LTATRLFRISEGRAPEIRPRRGGVVTQTAPERIMKTFEMSAEIEAMCVRIATYRISPLERGKLIEMHDASEALVMRGRHRRL